MSKSRNTLSGRLLAVLLSVVMIFSMIPLSAVSTFAATADHADWGVSVTVKDENGEALSGAAVTYHIDSVINGYDYETGTVTTDATGSAQILSKDKYVEGDLKLSAAVSLEDYTYADGSDAISDAAITSDGQDFAFTMKSTKVEKADQSLHFANYTGTETTIELSGTVPYAKEYDFSAIDSEKLAGGTISYAVELHGEDGDETEDTIAEINPATGLLKVYYPGTIVVKATLSGNEYYNDCTISHELKIIGATASDGQFIHFAQSQVSYVLGAYDGVASVQGAETENRNIRGKISYSMNPVDGLKLDKASGKVTVSDYTKVADAIRDAGGTLNVEIKAEKAAAPFYKADSASYILSIKFADKPENPYKLAELTKENGENGWYREPVTVTPTENYIIAKNEPKNFDSTTELDDQGTATRYVYLQYVSDGTDDEITGHYNGEITDRIPIDNVKIDTEAPLANKENMKISYSEPNFKLTVKEFLSEITFGFYNPSVTVTFEATDETSGVDHLDWTYTREPDASTANCETETGELTFNADGKAELVLTAAEAKQYRGNLSFTVTDKAGNTSDGMDDTGHVIVIDTIAPNCVISYTDPKNTVKRGGKVQRFFSGDVTLTITVTENNFYEEDFALSVSKNGGKPEKVTPKWTLDTTSENANVYIGTYTLSGDGDYVVYAEYTDKSNNVGKLNDNYEKYPTATEKYMSDTITIDTVSPTMTVEYSKESNTVDNTRFYGIDKNGEFEVTLNITEANFDAENVIVNVTKNGGEATSVTPVWTGENNKHVGTFTVDNGDGDYVISVECKDQSGNPIKDESGDPIMYTSDTITIDTHKPVIGVFYQDQDHDITPINTLADKDGNQREYFDETRTAVVAIWEQNFNADDVRFNIVGKDAAGNEKDLKDLISKSEWENTGNIHQMTITYSGDANYTFDVNYSDLANNAADDYNPDYFTIDRVAPTITDVQYSASVLDTVLSSVDYGFYNAKMTVTVTATDDTSGVHQFDYSYLNAAGVSSVNAEILNQAIAEAEITYSDGERTATMSFEIPKLVLTKDNQFNGTVKFDAIDRSGHKVAQSETKRVVVDNIAPTATVTYNTPVNSVGGVSYYDGNINGTITINEANFYANDVMVMVSKDGGAAQVLPTSWTNSSVDIHVGKFTLSGDGDYIVSITYKDKSGNAMAAYKSNQLTIDTKIEEPTYTINGVQRSGDNGGSYKDAAEVTFNFTDQNYDTNTIKLTRTRFDKVEDVTSEFIKLGMNDKGGSGSISIPKDVECDGIYLLTVTMTDKAKHSTESHVRFTVNRFGSVYAYDDYLCSLIKDGGQHIKLNGNAAVTKDLVITEYNADRIVDGTLKILITRDGEPIDVIYTNRQANTGWFEYVYTISKNNFKEDGVYKITISSEDATGNTSTSVPENSIGANGEKILDVMTFTVDTVAPEIRNIINLENAIADKNAIVDGKLTVKYTVIDVGGLAKIEIYVNDQLVDTVDKFDNNNSYTGSFEISESNDVQKVRIVVTDIAGNVTDTASEEFDPGELYVFNDEVTVSTNFFVRWYRNTPLFWGSIGALVVIAAGGIFFFAKKKKKEEEDS